LAGKYLGKSFAQILSISTCHFNVHLAAWPQTLMNEELLPRKRRMEREDDAANLASGLVYDADKQTWMSERDDLSSKSLGMGGR